MRNIRKTAKELLKNACRVCPICDGRACAGEVPGMGGLGSGASFKNNVEALAGLRLNMRVIHDAGEPFTATRWLGLELSMPVVASPIAGIFNFNEAVSEDAYALSVLEGSRAAGVIGCTGDGVPPSIIDAALAGIARVNGHGIPFIKPWAGGELDGKLERAFASGCSVMGMDLDAAGLVTLRKMGRPVVPKTGKELAAIVEKVHKAGIRFLVKGVMTARDARLAVETGADGIVVSNHGGRVLDSTPGTAEVLPLIVGEVGGIIPIMVDGGVRTGGDVLKMLALGADVIGIGRPVTSAAIGGGSAGVTAFFDAVRGELVQTMILTGCRDIAAITKETLI
jgi:isopentenyl diphosphate isomerase/L-lactate dehydrogenase-like FMN-dependent dehydrogenase